MLLHLLQGPSLFEIFSSSPTLSPVLRCPEVLAGELGLWLQGALIWKFVNNVGPFKRTIPIWSSQTCPHLDPSRSGQKARDLAKAQSFTQLPKAP